MKNNKSMIETAVDVLNERAEGMKLIELWNEVSARLEIPEEEAANRIGHFYTDISFSDVICILPDNVCDLSSRHKYEETHEEVGIFYSEVEDNTGLDQDDIQDNKEYDQSMQGSVLSNDEEENEYDEDGLERIDHDREAASEALGIKEY